MGCELCMKTFFYYSVICVALGLSACGKKKKDLEQKKLAQSYFKLAYVELTDAQATAYHYKKALSYIDQALAIHADARYQGLKATLLFTLRQYDESRVFYELALADCSDLTLKAELSNNYACLLAHQGQHERARELFLQLSTDRHYLTPEVALVNLGKIDIERAAYTSALGYFQRAIALAPEYLDAHFYVAMAAHLNHDDGLAKQEVSTILYVDPENKAALSLQAQLI